MGKHLILTMTVLAILLFGIHSDNAYAAEVTPEVTSVSADRSVVEWDDHIIIDISYTSPVAPREINITYLPVFVYSGNYQNYMSGSAVNEFDYHNNCITDNLMINNSNESYYEPDSIKVIINKFDKSTGKGRIRYRRKVLGWNGEGGKMKLFKAELSFDDPFVYKGTNYGYNYDLAIPDQGACLYEAVTPVGSPVFNKFDSDPDFLASLRSLGDGDLAVVKPVDHHNMSSPETGSYSLMHFRKQYFDTIKGKNITLIVMAGWTNFMVINGKDIVKETKDVDLGLGFNMRGETKNGKLKLLAYIACPDNGTLPCSTRYYENYDRWYDLMNEGLQDDENPPEFTKDSFDHDLHACKIYYVNNGVLSKEDATILRDGKWFYYDLDHNSKFIATNADPSTVRSFTVTLKKELTYTGKKLKPAVKVSCEKGTSYKVKYSNRKSKNVGTYYVTVKGTKGGYGTQKIKYKIIPKGTKIRKLDASGKKITVKWKKQSARMSRSRITGYQIQIATNTKFTKNKKNVTVTGYSKTSKQISGLKSNKTYYVRIRTFMKTGGKTYYSKWSKRGKVKVKKQRKNKEKSKKKQG